MELRNFRNESRDDYLEAILMITKEKGYCRSIDISENLEVTKASVSVAVGKLLDDCLIMMDDKKHIRLTEKGREIAVLTLAKHCYLKSMLVNAGVDEEIAEREACAMEHAISEDSFDKLKQRYPVTEFIEQN